MNNSQKISMGKGVTRAQVAIKKKQNPQTDD